MPNYRLNTVYICGDTADVDALLAKIMVDGQLDFNTLIPMPPELQVSSGSRSDAAIAVAKWRDRKEDSKELDMHRFVPRFTGIHDAEVLVSMLEEEDAATDRSKEPLCAGNKDNELTLLDFGRLLLKNIEAHGHATWYDWCAANWNTKWNALDTAVHRRPHGNAVITFFTAWNPPIPFLEKLSAEAGEDLFVAYGDIDGL